jgi:Lon protease-like protein
MKFLPDKIPVFPLSGVIYFPKTNLPLNIFEERYIDLVNDAFRKNKLMGIIQCKKESKEVYKVGCLGRISDFQKNKDGRILINLTGLTRFEIIEEVNNSKLYREFKVLYKKFEIDLKSTSEIINANILMEKARIFFEKNGLLLNWKEFEKLDDTQQINTLAMIAPITNGEKQKLLESKTLNEKLKTLENIIKFYLYANDFKTQTLQ